MTSQLTGKIRLVKCPRCRKVLPELSNVPVYQCGGCDAVLQVKRRKNGTDDTGLHIQETDISQKNEVQHDYEGERSVDKVTETDHEATKARSDHQAEEMNCFSSGRESFEPAMYGAEDDDKILSKDINKHDQVGKGSESLSSPDDFDSSTEFGRHEIEVLSPISVAMSESQENSPPNQESSPFDEAHDEVDKKGEGSDEVSPSNELTCREIEDLSPDTGTSGDFDEDALSHYIFGNFTKKKLPALDSMDLVVAPKKLSRESISTENLSPPHVKLMDQSQLREATEVETITSKETLGNKESTINQKLENQVLPPKEFTCQKLEDPSPVVVIGSELEENSISRFIFGNLTPGGSVINSPTLSDESRLQENPISRHNQQMKQPQLGEPTRSNSVSSEGKLEKVVFTNADSTHRSSYGYDGSVSSFGETDDQDRDQYLRLLKGKYTEAEPSHVNVVHINRSREKRHEATGHGRPVRSRMQFQSDERLSRAHVHSRVSPMGYGYGSSSNYAPNHGENTKSSPMTEEEKLKLKKLVLELQDQLNRSHTPKGYARGVLNPVPPCYHVSSELDMCHDLSHNGYPNRRYQSEAFPNHCKFSRIPFSAEAAINRPQMCHSCLQLSPHDWHCSAPLSPHFYSKPSQCTAHLNCVHHNTHCSCSDFSVKNCEMMCKDDWHKHLEEKRKYKDRKYATRQHILPVKGGAPFIVCDNCSELLQLPGDFLLFRKRYHQLRCSSCSYVLKFSLRDGYKLDRYVVVDESGNLAPAPPPSEVGDLIEMNKGKKMSYGGSCSHADPVCFSDDYGPSICKSCSTETEPISVVLPFDVQKVESNGKKVISGGSIDHLNLRKDQSVLKESNKDMVFRAGKPSPVIERVRGTDVSPLHRLMGYNSAREVLNK